MCDRGTCILPLVLDHSSLQPLVSRPGILVLHRNNPRIATRITAWLGHKEGRRLQEVTEGWAVIDDTDRHCAEATAHCFALPCESGQTQALPEAVRPFIGPKESDAYLFLTVLCQRRSGLVGISSGRCYAFPSSPCICRKLFPRPYFDFNFNTKEKMGFSNHFKRQ